VTKPLLVLIPGLDGTGELFGPLLDLVPETIQTKVVTYSDCDSRQFETVVDHIAEQIPNDRQIVIVAESFGGPVAVSLLQRNFEVVACVFCATFTKAPYKLLLALTKYLPTKFLLSKPLPKAILKYGFLAGDVPQERVKLIQQSILGVPAHKLSERLNLLATIDVTYQLKNLPNIRYCYIKAKNDWLVPGRCAGNFVKGLQDIELIEVDGGHFVLQANPAECWRVIERLLVN
jgi:pimeloyl-ACP methyl ester carboxylesterase